MAKYNVTYQCGHEGVVELYGKHTARESKLAWMSENMVCPECYAAQRDAARAKETAKAEKVADSNGWPKLTGSPKQIAWAETLRAKKLGDPFVDAIKNPEKQKAAIAALPADKNKEAFTKAVEKIVSLITEAEKETSAKFFIDYQKAYKDLLQEYYDKFNAEIKVV
jgi:hypothetical protein